jgi:polyketide synthase PksN
VVKEIKTGVQPDKELILKGKGVKEDYTKTEKKVARVWQQVLGYEEIDINDNFFEIGGDSLLLVQVYQKLSKLYPNQLTVAQLFSYPTIVKLAEYLSRDEGLREATPRISFPVKLDSPRNNDIAIVGIAAKTSLAHNLQDFWHNLKIGKDCIINIPKNRKYDIDRYQEFRNSKNNNILDNNTQYRKTGYINNIDKFDYQYFGISPKEAELMDPNQRLFLETVYTVINDANLEKKLKNTKTGLYLGYTSNNIYRQMISVISPSLFSQSIPGHMTGITSSRVSHILNLRGPSMVTDTT